MASAQRLGLTKIGIVGSEQFIESSRAARTRAGGRSQYDMDFARQQRDPTRHVIGIAFVILVHVLVIYALVTGLGARRVEVIKKPLTATIIEEIKLPPPPPPPPPPKKIETPKVQPPPEQPYVPPPDIPPPVTPTEPVISAPTHRAADRAARDRAAAAAGAAAAAEAGDSPGHVVPIDKDDPIFPREAIRAGVEKGKVVARLHDRREGQRHRRQDRRAPIRRACSTARSSDALIAVEVQGRRREVRRRGRGQLHARRTSSARTRAGETKRPPRGGRLFA